MHNSKLFHILRSFSKQDMKEFEKYLSSPFFGYKAFVLNFFRHISKYHPHYDKENIDKKSLYRKAYKDRKYSDGLVRRLVSDLIRASEDYLTLKNFRKNSIFCNACLLNELRSRGLNESFRVRSESLLRKLERSDITDAELLLNKYFVNLEMKEFMTSLRNERMHEAYDRTAEAVSVFFLRSFLAYMNHVETFKRPDMSESSIPLLLFRSIDVKKLLRSLEDYSGKLSPYVNMMIYNYKLVNDRSNTANYRKIISLLNRHTNYFSEQELRNIHVNISKFFSFQNNLNSNNFLKETYELYELFLSKYYKQSPLLTLQLSFCRNYINACKTTGNAERIREFRKKYAGNFPDAHRRNMELLCEAVYDFEERNFAEALKSAAEINFQQPVFAKDVRILKIKCMYELGYYETVRSETDNLRHFLKSTVLLTAQSISRGKHFASLVSQLLKFQSSRDQGAELLLLKKKIAGAKYLNETKWLLSKTEELLSRQS